MTLPDPPSPTPRQSTPSNPRGGRTRTITILATLLLLAAIGTWAFFLRSNPPSKGGPKPSPTATNSASPAVSPPIDPQASDNLDTAFRAIYAKRTRATVERRPEIVDEIYLPDCNCYELKSMIENSIKRQGHHVGYDPTVLLIRLATPSDSSGSDIKAVQVVTQQGPFTIVDDRNGRVILNDPGWAPQASYWELFRSNAGAPWKVSLLVVQGSPEKVLGPSWNEGPR